MRTPNLKDLTEAWADRYCTEFADLAHDDGCPARQKARDWLQEELRQAKEQALEEAARELDHLANDFTINRGNYALEDDSPAQMIALASVTIRNLKDNQ